MLKPTSELKSAHGISVELCALQGGRLTWTYLCLLPDDWFPFPAAFQAMSIHFDLLL